MLENLSTGSSGENLLSLSPISFQLSQHVLVSLYPCGQQIMTFSDVRDQLPVS